MCMSVCCVSDSWRCSALCPSFPFRSDGWGGDYDQIQRYLDDDQPAFIIFFKGRGEVSRDQTRDKQSRPREATQTRPTLIRAMLLLVCPISLFFLQYLLLLYVPDSSLVKHKMSYSASKGALNTMLNARQFGSSGASTGSSKAVEQIFGTTKAEFTKAAYNAHNAVKGPMSEVEEALQALPKQLEKKDFGKVGTKQ